MWKYQQARTFGVKVKTTSNHGRTKDGVKNTVSPLPILSRYVCVCGRAKLNQRVYVNPLTGVPINSPVDHSPAKSRGATLAVILECHSCPPELLFVRNAGEIQHVIRSGGAL